MIIGIIFFISSSLIVTQSIDVDSIYDNKNLLLNSGNHTINGIVKPSRLVVEAGSTIIFTSKQSQIILDSTQVVIRGVKDKKINLQRQYNNIDYDYIFMKNSKTDKNGSIEIKI